MFSTRGALVAEAVEVVHKLGEFYLHLLDLPFVYQFYAKITIVRTRVNISNSFSKAGPAASSLFG